MAKYKTDYKPGDRFPLPRQKGNGIVQSVYNDRYDLEVYDPDTGGFWYFTVNKTTGLSTYKGFIPKDQVKKVPDYLD